MIDYHSHIAALRVMEVALAATLSGDPALAGIDSALHAKKSYAALGTLIDHLLEHDGDADQEMHLLEEGAAIWGGVTNMLSTVATIRQQFEALVLDPTQPDLVPKYNGMWSAVQSMKPAFSDLTAQLQGFYAELKLLNYLKPHGQELDEPVKDWSWKDIILSRRTGAFTHTLANLAREDGGKDAIAFAYGAISGYAADVTGSSYLVQTVRGPRRSHLIRDRVASYTTAARVNDFETQVHGVY